jgi:hypothetical protein
MKDNEISKRNFPGLTASKEVEAYLTVRQLLDELANLTIADLVGFSADEILGLFQDICLIGKEFFSEEFISHRSNNPDLIVGYTETDPNDKSSVGTVSSRKKAIDPARRLPPNPAMVRWLEELFLKAKSLKVAFAKGIEPEVVTVPRINIRKNIDSEIRVEQQSIRLKDFRKEHRLRRSQMSPSKPEKKLDSMKTTRSRKSTKTSRRNL